MDLGGNQVEKILDLMRERLKTVDSLREEEVERIICSVTEDKTK